MIWLLLACVGASDSVDSAGGAPQAWAAVELAVVEVGQTVNFDGSGSEGKSFAWFPGDGSELTGQNVQHIYTEPGQYSAVLTVTGVDSSRSSSAVKVEVHLPLLETPPQRSGLIWLEDNTAWVLTPEASVLAEIDLERDQKTEISVCKNPRSVARFNDSTAVACPQVLWVDGVEVALPEGSQARAVLGSAQGWVVSLAGVDSVQRWDGAAWTVLLNVVDPGPLAHAGESWAVARFRSAPEYGEIWVFGADSPHLIQLQDDTRPDSDTTTGGVPNLFEQLLFSPDGGWLFAPGVQANHKRGLYKSGEAMNQETTIVAVVTMAEVAGAEHAGAEDFERRRQFDDRGRAIAAVTSTTGNMLYVLHPGTQTVSVVDVWSGNQAGSILQVGAGPRDLWLEGNTLYVYAWLDRSLVAFDLGDPTYPLESGRWSTLNEEPLSEQVLAGKKLFWNSSDPRITRDGYLACAHCHPDGGDDGQTWDFTDRGEGLRNTTSLLGRAGTGMGPLHWSGNFDEVQDFENDLRLHFGGTGLLSEADWGATLDTLGSPKAGLSTDLDALAAYVTSLDESLPGVGPGSYDGELVFEEQNCSSCHPAPLYTDSAAGVRHDIGSIGAASGERLGEVLDGLDTPTLLGAWDSPPYLHDGSAEDLEDAVRAHDGVVISDTDMENLLAFLRGLGGS